MTLLADGALRADSYRVAKQTTSLPSASKSDPVASASAVEPEAEGGAFVDEPAIDVVSIASDSQTRNAEATQETGIPPALGPPEGQLGEANREALEEAREAERERLEKIKTELNERLNENLSLKFGKDESTGRDFFQLIEKDTGDVVRQIPSQNIIDFMKKFKDFSGLLFNQSA
jgi:flagellar protein FlaG